MQSSLKRGIFLLVLAAPLLVAGCGDDAPVVWPISAETATDFPLSSTFGPRIHTDDSVFDFHRGIDIAVPTGTDIHAIAKGKVVQIEQNTSAGGMLVQLEHDGYYSNYIHASEVEVDVGDEVDPGDVIAKSGKATNGFEHLHFEIRKPADGKKDCVHPLEILPYADKGAPRLSLGALDTTNPLVPSVTAKVDVPGVELDLKRVSVSTYDADVGASLAGLKPLSEQVYDLEDWNRTYTQSDSDALVDDPDLEGILVRPQKFNNTMGTWTIEFTFTKLTGPSLASKLRVRIEATDVKGNVVSVESP
jgi:murein DD-endopeptidase MepM/ murein hydrolase activator NlpD